MSNSEVEEIKKRLSVAVEVGSGADLSMDPQVRNLMIRVDELTERLERLEQLVVDGDGDGGGGSGGSGGGGGRRGRRGGRGKDKRRARTGAAGLADLAERLAPRVVNWGVEDACWEWTGLSRNVSVQGRQTTASRAVWIALQGELPEGCYIVPTRECPGNVESGRAADCVNPGHRRMARQWESRSGDSDRSIG
jgi:hypothetical protein